jgi:ribonuclease Z
MVELTILGSGSMVPTKDRNVQAFYLDVEGEGLLFDCGEGTQRQMNVAGISRAKVRRIFISHWHGDHVAGLIGLIQTMGNSNYDGTLHVYGPTGTKEKMFHILSATIFEHKIPIKVEEVMPKRGETALVCETEKWSVVAARLDHSVPCIGFSWIEKDRVRVNMPVAQKLGLKEGPQIGKLTRGESIILNGETVMPEDVLYKVAGRKVTIISDTQPCAELAVLAQYADIVVCEATYCSKHDEKSEDVKHMTAQAAARVAQAADAKRLILTHFSQRYPSVHDHVDEARAVFPNTDAAFDLMKITL